MLFLQQERLRTCRLYQQKHSQAVVREKNYCPLSSSPEDDIWRAVPCLGLLNVRNLLSNWTKCSGKPPKCLVAGGAGLAQPEEQEALGRGLMAAC